MPGFARELEVTTGSLGDWAYFARWHYRSHRVGSLRFLTVLWHGERPVGICVFTTAPLSLAGRNRFFGRGGRWTRLSLRSLNRQLVSLSRVVLHPTYRGAGIAAAFVRRSCEACPYPWIESLAGMGRVNPFFEKAGFTRVDVPPRRHAGRAGHSAVYGTPGAGRKKNKRLVTPETHAKSLYAEPVYYVFDNRENVAVPHDAFGARSPLSLGRGAGGEGFSSTSIAHSFPHEPEASAPGAKRAHRQTTPLTPDPSPQGEGNRNRVRREPPTPPAG